MEILSCFSVPILYSMRRMVHSVQHDKKIRHCEERSNPRLADSLCLPGIASSFLLNDVFFSLLKPFFPLLTPHRLPRAKGYRACFALWRNGKPLWLGNDNRF